MSKRILEVKNLKTQFFTDRGVVKAVDGVSFNVDAGKTLCIVGESGCGKSVTSMSVMRLVSNPGKIVEGQMFYNGQDMVNLDESEMRSIRGNEISMIFQEPMTSLNPVFTIGYQIQEILLLHRNITKKEAREKSIEMLNLVGIPRAEKIVDEYPHQLSGGMRQRVMIAMALSCEPNVLIADEPTTALDVTIQAQILDLMNGLKKKLNTGIMMITHDLGVVAEMADYVVVMYAGKVVEEAEVKELFKKPTHPYTIGLLKSIPKLEGNSDILDTIEGSVPNPLHLPEGCYFAPRCKFATEKCRTTMPELRNMGNGHKVRCFLVEGEEA
ncbi:ABC transporter ATP-binding protein [Helicovermis profundi]|uniref:ABC transporter ATP-binding protein n=1 Tax=Helicovermis profundi TaxID=3065157 RepID=A0AAU9E2G0_9FIRM|nr:ABC transporter ATP-binding protein [Clostridia bacterium S502]